MENLIERWISIPDYEGLYEISSGGRARSLSRVINAPQGFRRIPGKLLNPSLTKFGYLRLTLSRDGKAKSHFVHALVLIAFVGARPKGMDACHENGTKDDNRLENLRWDTRSENVYDLVRHGAHNNARKTECKRGHEFAEGNTYLHPDGRRQCKKCRDETRASWESERRLA